MKVSISHICVLAITMLGLMVGCSSEKKEEEQGPPMVPPKVEIPAESSPPGEVSTEPPRGEPAEETAGGATPLAKPVSPENKQPAADAGKQPAAGSGVTAKVVLGTAELTAGIPGTGPLEVAQIEAWLGRAENHVPLEVDLPLGLSAGSQQMRGIAKNPMTRAKIELGRQLFFDPRLSANKTIRCASCHDPDEGYARHTQFGVGINKQHGTRNSPVSYNRLLSGPQFWDGRAASLEAQAVGPIANPIEMGNTHEQVVKTLQGVDGYRIQFEKIFPGEGVTIDNIGKAIATFERALVTGPSPYDFYEIVRNMKSQYDADEIKDLKKEDPALYARYQQAVEGSQGMSASAIRGRELFFTDKANCTACHVGANFTDEKYHNLGVGMDKQNPDLGRYNVTKDVKDRGAFKTPTLRNVALSAPYMHDGSQQTLDEVVSWYNKGGHPNPQLSDKIKKLNLTDEQQHDLVAFMKALTGSFPPVERDRLPK